MASQWREQMALHLENAARYLKDRHDRQVERHIQLAIGYLERAGQPGNSKNAARLLAALRRSLGEYEQTLRMKFDGESDTLDGRDSMHGPDSIRSSDTLDGRDSIEVVPSEPAPRRRGRR